MIADTTHAEGVCHAHTQIAGRGPDSMAWLTYAQLKREMSHFFRVALCRVNAYRTAEVCDLEQAHSYVSLERD